MFPGICVITSHEAAIVCATSEQRTGGHKSAGTVIQKAYTLSFIRFIQFVYSEK
jgi:hypothetical protein